MFGGIIQFLAALEIERIHPFLPNILVQFILFFISSFTVLSFLKLFGHMVSEPVPNGNWPKHFVFLQPFSRKFNFLCQIVSVPKYYVISVLGVNRTRNLQVRNTRSNHKATSTHEKMKKNST